MKNSDYFYITISIIVVTILIYISGSINKKEIPNDFVINMNGDFIAVDRLVIRSSLVQMRNFILETHINAKYIDKVKFVNKDLSDFVLRNKLEYNISEAYDKYLDLLNSIDKTKIVRDDIDENDDLKHELAQTIVLMNSVIAVLSNNTINGSLRFNNIKELFDDIHKEIDNYGDYSDKIDLEFASKKIIDFADIANEEDTPLYAVTQKKVSIKDAKNDDYLKNCNSQFVQDSENNICGNKKMIHLYQFCDINKMKEERRARQQLTMDLKFNRSLRNDYDYLDN